MSTFAPPCMLVAVPSVAPSWSPTCCNPHQKRIVAIRMRQLILPRSDHRLVCSCCAIVVHVQLSGLPLHMARRVHGLRLWLHPNALCRPAGFTRPNTLANLRRSSAAVRWMQGRPASIWRCLQKPRLLMIPSAALAPPKSPPLCSTRILSTSQPVPMFPRQT